MFGVSASGTGDGPPSKLVCRRSTASGRAWMDVEHKIHERARAPLLELVPLTKETMAEIIENTKDLNLPGNVRLPGATVILPLHWLLSFVKNFDGPALRALDPADEAARAKVPEPVLRGGDMLSKLIMGEPPEQASANQLCDLLATLDFWQAPEAAFRKIVYMSTGAPFKVMLAVCDVVARLFGKAGRMLIHKLILENMEPSGAGCSDPRGFMDDLLDACVTDGMGNLCDHVMYTASRAFVIVGESQPAAAFVYIAVAAVMADGDGSDNFISSMASNIADAALLLAPTNTTRAHGEVDLVPDHLRRHTIHWLLRQSRKNTFSMGSGLERVICALATGERPDGIGELLTPNGKQMVPTSAVWFSDVCENDACDVTFSTLVNSTTSDESQDLYNDVFGVGLRVRLMNQVAVIDIADPPTDVEQCLTSVVVTDRDGVTREEERSSGGAAVVIVDCEQGVDMTLSISVRVTI